jgi:hypothetical protein
VQAPDGLAEGALQVVRLAASHCRGAKG